MEVNQTQQHECAVLLSHVAVELEQLRTVKAMASISSSSFVKAAQVQHASDVGISFPPACRHLLKLLPGNKVCADCGSPNPTWASISFGTLHCILCSGQHRSYGVQTSFIRSIDMDTWNHTQVLSMLEGGNAQWQSFLERHRLAKSNAVTPKLYQARYHTKAAQFYRTNLAQHVIKVAQSGCYQGRDIYRQANYSDDSRKSIKPSIAPLPAQLTRAKLRRQRSCSIEAATVSVESCSSSSVKSNPDDSLSACSSSSSSSASTMDASSSESNSNSACDIHKSSITSLVLPVREISWSSIKTAST